MKRGVLIAFGAVWILCGTLLVAAGVVLASVLGPASTISTPVTRLVGTGVALIVDNLVIDVSSVPLPARLGSLTLRVAAPDGRPMFAGSARTTDVDAYLSGAPYDAVAHLSTGGGSQTRSVPGTRRPPVGGAVNFWSYQGTGDPAVLTARLEPGSTLVIMNADAAVGVTADVAVTLTIPGAWAAPWACGGSGLALLAVGALTLWRASSVQRSDVGSHELLPTASGRGLRRRTRT